MDDWKARAIKRRDFRHTHDDPPERNRRAGRRSRRKWCKGKPGVEHVWEKQNYGAKWGLGNHRYMIDRCTACGKWKW